MLNAFLGRRFLSNIRLVDPKEVQRKIESAPFLHLPSHLLILYRTSLLSGANQGWQKSPYLYRLPVQWAKGRHYHKAYIW